MIECKRAGCTREVWKNTAYCSQVCYDLHRLTRRLETMRDNATGDTANALLAACVAVHEAAQWVSRAE
ncbi:hypothetical protein SAMN05216215_104741 [Saccharopolyspora shandongensis]|uniref:Uncharacterized protein n=1 Tax=Saccharopolyspora shandongensis TaxID=418495 RepID=A0A1H3QEN6_9PSEU|nr:hypothetical protein SAMN05216215_104741 [Saccharopolyspora shandongensis]